MNIITGAAPLYHHTSEDGYRSVASRFLVGHLELDGAWEEFAQSLRDDVVERPTRYNLAPGKIDHTCAPDLDAALRACMDALTGLGIHTAPPNAFDLQTLVCRGAEFHDDLHGWDNALFLNWYVAGPPREFAMAGLGHITIRPGDVILFDPSRPHALAQEGEHRFLKRGWGAAPEDLSFFLSADIVLTPELDVLFGIERGSADFFLARSSVDIDQLKVRPMNGAVYTPRSRLPR